MSNAGANQSIVPSSRTLASNFLIHPRIASHPPNNQFEINMMGNMIDYDFYIPDVTGDSTGLAFRVAYNAPRHSSNGTKGLCVSVGSMLCSVVPTFRNSVVAALNGIGIRPRFVSLPSQALENNIVVSDFPELDWSSILVIFGYCILLLFKIDSKLFNSYVGWAGSSLHTKRVDELRKKVGCLSYYLPLIPFEQLTEIPITDILGTHALRNSVINFLMNNFNNRDPKICGLCQYLGYVLSWSGDMGVFTLMNERIVKTNSPVLADSRVIAEVEHLEELINAIATHTYPQYFSHLCLTSELFYLDVKRFPTLFCVAKLLEEGRDSLDFFDSTQGANKKTVEELVKLHRAAMLQNRVFTERRLPTIPGF